MRTALAIVTGLLVCAGVSVSQPAQAQRAADACQGRKALGVARTVEIDAARGPRFGHQQYKDLSFLNEGEVVLTFDDGPLRTYTRSVLEALDAHCTKATFFVVGRMAVADPEMVREMVRRGHTVGTHTWSHRNLRAAGAANARHEIELGISAVQRAAGVPIAPFFRFPYLADPAHAQSYLQSRDIAMFSIEVDAYDYRSASPELVHRNVMSQLANHRKGIVLFHDIQPATAGALKRLLDELAAKQYRVVHIVAKQPTTTIASFDALAERELSRRKQQLLAQPLASRSLVWPVAPAPSATIGVGSPPLSGQPPGAAVVRQQPVLQRPPAPVAVAPVVAPVAPPPQVVPEPAPAPRPVRPRAGDPSWQDRVFGVN